jgi:hypothetical protein
VISRHINRRWERLAVHRRVCNDCTPPPLLRSGGATFCIDLGVVGSRSPNLYDSAPLPIVVDARNLSAEALRDAKNPNYNSEICEYQTNPFGEMGLARGIARARLAMGLPLKTGSGFFTLRAGAISKSTRGS